MCVLRKLSIEFITKVEWKILSRIYCIHDSGKNDALNLHKIEKATVLCEPNYTVFSSWETTLCFALYQFEARSLDYYHLDCAQ